MTDTKPTIEDLTDAYAEEIQNSIDFAAWEAQGLARGWVGPMSCDTHDGMATTALEEDVMDLTGEYPCILAMRPPQSPVEVQDDDDNDISDVCTPLFRLYANAAMKAAVEEYHEPSVWRQSMTS